MKTILGVLLVISLGGSAVAAAPAPPTSLAFTVSATGMVLNWTASTSSPVTYCVFRSLSSGASSLLGAGINATSFTDSTDFGGKSYFYSVVAVDGSPSTSQVLSHSKAVPEPPLNVPLISPQATGNSGEVQLSWVNVADPPGVTHFAVYYSQDPAAPNYASTLTVTAASLTVTALETGLTNCVAYYFWAAPVVGPLGQGSPALLGSAQPYTGPDAPTITAYAPMAFSGDLGLTFTAAVPGSCGLAGYYIYVNTSFTPEAFLENGETYWEFTPACGITQTAWVQAVDDLGNLGPFSAPMAAAAPCPPVLNAAATTINNGTVTLNWTAPSPAVNPVIYYVVHRATGPGSDISNSDIYLHLAGSAPGSATSFSDSPPSGVVAWYRMYAVDSQGTTSLATQEISILAPPSSLAAIPSNGKVLLTWADAQTSSNTGITGYAVYYSACPTTFCAAALAGQTAGLSMSVSFLANGTPLWFSVASLGGGLSGTASLPVSATPNIMSSAFIFASASLGGPLVISWTASNADAAPNTPVSYQLLRDATSLTITFSNGFTDTGFSGVVAPVVYSLTTLDTLSNASPAVFASLTKPASPSGLTARAGDHRVSLSWTTVPGASKYRLYRIYRASYSGGPDVLTSPTGYETTGNGFLDTDVVNGTPLTYTVTALSQGLGGGWLESVSASALSAMTSVGPGAPGSLTLTSTVWINPLGGRMVFLRWQAASLGTFDITKYAVYRGVSAATDLLATTPSAGVGSQCFMDACDSAYHYQVFAVDTAGNTGPASSEFNAAFTLLGAPTGQVSITTTGQVNLAWNAAGGGTYPVSRYLVYRATYTSAGRGGLLLTSTSGRTFSDAMPDFADYYDIFSVDSAGNTCASFWETAASLAPPPPSGSPSAVSGVALALDQPLPMQVTVRWLPNPSSEGVSVYEVFRGNTFTSMGTVAGQNFLADPTPFAAYGVQSMPYWVHAWPSGPLSLTVTLANLTPPPPRISLANYGDKSLLISWPQVDVGGGFFADTYDVWRDGSFLGSTASLAWLDTGLNTSNAHTYVAYSVRSSVSSVASNSVMGQSKSSPAIPGSLTAVAQPGIIRLSWDFDASALSYGIYKAPGQISVTEPLLLTPVAYVTGHTYEDVTPSGDAVYYAVAGFNTMGRGPGFATFQPVTALPAAASGLAVVPGYEAGTAQVSLAWVTPTALGYEATGYNVYRNLGFYAYTTQAALVDTAAPTNTALTYAVESFNGAAGPMSITLTTRVYLPASAPLSLTAQPLNTGLQLSWMPLDASQGVTGYAVFLGPTPVTQTSASYYAAMGLFNHTAYTFTVAGLNSAGAGAMASVSGTPNADAAPPAPAGLSALSGYQAGSKVFLSWKAAAGAASYRVYRATYVLTGNNAGGGSSNPAYYMALTSGAASFVTDTAAQDDGTLAYYALTSLDSLGRESGPASTWVLPYRSCGPVTGYTVREGVGRIDIAWAPPLDAGSAGLAALPYRVYRYVAPSPQSVSLAMARAGGIYAQTASCVFTDEHPAYSPPPSTVSNYYFIVTVDSRGRESNVSVSFPNLAPGGVPQQPVLFTALAGDGKVTLVWVIQDPDAPAALGARYNVYRGVGPAFLEPLVTEQGPSSAQGSVGFITCYYPDSNHVVNLTTYYYALAQTNKYGEGPKSGVVSIIPYRPLSGPPGTDLVTTRLVNKSQVNLSWPAMPPPDLLQSYNLDLYRVYRSQDGGATYTPLSDVAQVTGLAAYSYTDTHTIFGTFYVYRVVPVDTEGHEGYSYQVARVQIPAPKNNLILDHNAINPERGEKLGIQYSLVQPGKIWIRIFTLNGEFVATVLEEDVPVASDDNPFISPMAYWDGKNIEGRNVASGVYLIHMEGPTERFNAKVAVIK